MVTEHPYYSNDRGNARYTGKGCRRCPTDLFKAVPEGASGQE